MGKKLAIRSHVSRGKDIIELFKMMGGCECGYCGCGTGYYYYISQFGNIEASCKPTDFDTYIVYTLEEFLEKYPFKIGDKVIDTADGCPGIVSEMKWDEGLSDMKYFVTFGNGVDFGWYANDSIEFCKETDTVKPVTNKSERTHEDVIFDSIIWHLRNSVNNGKQNLSGGECEDYFREVVKKNNENKMKNVLAELLEHIKNTSKEELEKEFNELEEWSNVGPTAEEFMTFCECVNKKPKYPDNYEECVRIAKNIHGYYINIDAPAYRELMELFIKLLICRDAYWKIAGEQMGLGKSWEPDWNESKPKYTIVVLENKLVKHYALTLNYILAFPTEEIRDAFYDNFKDLIEQCKELL